MSEIRPFRLHVPDEVLDDLRARLRRTRLLEDSPRRMPSGMSARWLRELVETWTDWDWRAREEWLAGFPQFLTEIDGTDIHFAHLRSEQPDAPVLLIMHGWPHTFALQLDITTLLPDFDVVVASLPGFAFSEPYADGPMSERRLAETMHRLMTDVLGYETYITYGEDVTANVSDLIAGAHPGQVAGIVATHAHFGTPAEREASDDPEVRAFFARLDAEHGPNGSYGHVQWARPDTLAAALNDSPAGLLAWIAEKLAEWSDTPGDEPASVEAVISRDRILTEAMIYWVTQSIATSFRPYYEGADTPEAMPPVDIPAAVHVQRHEHDFPEALARKFYTDLRVFERLDRGGHFTVAEAPEAMAERFRAFATGLRD
ncbi:epoxide hydrolase family protein [Microbacterium sp. MYb66]|uniref:epoxide hydrolase family protein n=1 Tax=Microbacterium sp. MYb66 TaxID=1848692 RepID=UPI000CFEACBB|nr:epoxide hydrolase family protein [Microbacterium sp. MYb66]PRA81533.1 epoxide hydrolase [Microbacterium sp. MYb66]